MTLTTPMCPLGPYLDQEVRTAVSDVPGVEDVSVNLVWQPAWDPSKMSEDAKLELGFALQPRFGPVADEVLRALDQAVLATLGERQKAALARALKGVMNL